MPVALRHAGDHVLGRRRQHLPSAGWRATLRRRCLYAAASSSLAGDPQSQQQKKKLTILHFNDVYNIEQRAIEPVGGAARFAAAMHQFRHEHPLVLFSGDCLNPSLMSAFTRGEQMVPILNALGVHAAAVGNHEFDFGIPTLRKHMQSFRFPWLLSNVLDAHTGKPLGGAERSRIVTCQGVKVGLMGLVEREWLLTIPSVEESDIHFLDFCGEGRQLAAELAAEGAELIVALTHMRTPNDLVLAAEVPEIQLVLGGHDHHWEATVSRPHGTLVLKSGTDFREFSVLRMSVPASLQDRPQISWERVEISSAVPEDTEMAAIVKKYQDIIGTKMDEPMGWTHTDLDARFDTVRRSESNLANLFADVMRISLGADAAFFNGGTIRSDQMHGAGQLLMRDFVSMLPFTDDLVLLELSGAALLQVLETGVGGLPALEGRFLQISGIRFAFDVKRLAGSRVVPGSVEVAGQPLDPNRMYKVATKAYLRGGKDGFESLKGSTVLVDGETNPRLATLVQYLWMRVEQLNEQLAEEWARMVQHEHLQHMASYDAGQQEDAVSADAERQGSNGSSHASLQQSAEAPAASSSNGSSSTNGSANSDSRNDSNGNAAIAAEPAVRASALGSIDAVYSPGSPMSGTATGGPGSIPFAAEQRVHEVSSTGAAISLALLLEQRSELGLKLGSEGGEGEGSSGEGAAEDQWVSLLSSKQQAHSSAALWALAYLEPCTHGLDELIVFDAVRRRFGIGPREEGRIRNVADT